MKKWLVGSLVGALLLFFWQFFSWAASGLHDAEYKHHPQQDQIMAALSSTIKEDGQYMIPRSKPDASREQMEAEMKAMEGKPFAVVTYQSKYEIKMVMSMVRGFFVDLVIVLLLIYIIGRRPNLSIGNVWSVTISVGFIAWLWHPYTQNIWFQTPVAVLTGALVDWIVAYSLVGLWLGWWLRRFNNY